MSLIPPIGTAGIYQLKAPFASHLQPSVSYRCDAVRRVSDMVEAGIDPFAEFYETNGIDESKYNQDLLNNVCIVSLVSAAGHWVYVPSSYILSYPNVNGVPYRVMLLGVELGPIPDYMDLSVVKSSVADVVRDTIGITPQIKEVAISPIQNFSQNDHDVVEANRQAAILSSPTWKAKYLDIERRFTALQQAYNELAAIVQNNAP